MKLKVCVPILFVFAAITATNSFAESDAQAKLKAVVNKYMKMKGDPVPGVAVEMAEFVDREQTIVTMAETEIINALKKAGITVLAKGKPEFIIYGGVESNWSGQQVAFGTDVTVYDATITLKVIDTRKGIVIDTASAQVRKPHTSREKASREAIKEAGNAVAKKIVGILKPKTKTVE